MAVEIIGKMKPKNNGSFKLVDAVDVEMPDGSSLADFNSVPPLVNGAEVDVPIVNEKYYLLDPDTYYAFGVVDSLAVSCTDPSDGKLHEFNFEFVPSEEFTSIEFDGDALTWATDPNLVPGKLCQVSIVRGIGVMICA